MDSYDIVHVAVLPPNIVDTENIQRVATIIDKNLYETRLLLAGKIPRIIAHYGNPQTAESTVRSLRSLGISAIACEDKELRKPSHSFRAHTLQFGQKESMFLDRSGQSIKMESTDVFLIITGTVETEEDREVNRTRTKLNLPITLLTGGIPVRRKVTEKVKETSYQNEHFMRMYDKRASGFNVEIRQYDFDYSCLGKEIALSSSTNFNTLTARIREAFPQAIFDDRLKRKSSLDLPSTTPWETVDIICKLIYLFIQS